MLTWNAKFGLVLFGLYLVLYGVFVLLNALSPSAMESTPVGGINLAILYGIGLIIAALLSAFVYGFFCKPEADEPNSDEGGPQ